MIVGIGTDIVSVSRFRNSLNNFGTKLEARLFTGNEIQYCGMQKDSAPSFAVRFAAKEAAMKALGVGLACGISWHDVEILRGDNGRPYINAGGKFREIADGLGVTKIWVTLSHSDENAVAFVVLEKD